LEGQCDFREVLTRLVRLERETVTLAGAVKIHAASLQDRAARLVLRQHGYRAMMKALMEAASQTKVELPDATVFVARDKAGCIITDETALPDKYVRVERVPKKTDILAALMSGERIEGAEMKNSGSTHISIRV
jgi:type II secretory pathway predicted ATPase ExeA